MRIDQKDIENIRKRFGQMQTKEDLVALLSEAKNLMYGEDCKPFLLKSISYYANPFICKKRYSSFSIKKKSGGERIEID